MHVHRKRVDTGNASGTERVGGVPCRAQDRCPRLGSLIQAGLIGRAEGLQCVEISSDIPATIVFS